MDVYCKDDINKKSQWLSVTPTESSLCMPFYMTEIGHFYTNQNYKVKRNYHDSYLMFYTISGEGIVIENNTKICLSPGNMVIIDCHKPHEYFSHSQIWEFMWMHFSGNNVHKLLKLLYPENIFPIEIKYRYEIQKNIQEILISANDTSLINASEISQRIHSIYSILLKDSLKNEVSDHHTKPDQYVGQVMEYVKMNYTKSICINDMLCGIPVSKYYFIRIFKRIYLYFI